MPDLEPKSWVGELAVSNQWQLTRIDVKGSVSADSVSRANGFE
jgi:hypothetical protein